MPIANVIKPIVKIGKNSIRFIAKNSNLILTVIGIAGAISLVPITIQGTIKAMKLKEEKQVEGTKETIKTVWKCYIPTIGVVLLTTMAIASNGKINAKRLATVTALYAATRDDLKKYTDKVKDTLGEGKDRKVREELAKDEVANVPKIALTDIHDTGHGNVIFKEHWTGQLFRASKDYIDLVREQTNNALKDEVDNIVQFSYVSDKLCLRDSGFDLAFWDLTELLKQGYSDGLVFDVTDVKWMNVGGEDVMVSTLWIRPGPSDIV